MTKLACWNVRGLNSPLRQKEVRDFTCKNNIGLFGLVEVKINLKNRELFAKRIFRSWELAYNSLPNAVSRIWVAWNPYLFEGSQLHSHEQAITLRMKNKNNPGDIFILTVVYGYNAKSNRRESWRELRYQYQIYGNQPWIIMGDFNIVLDGQGKIGRKRINRYVVKEFRD